MDVDMFAKCKHVIDIDNFTDPIPMFPFGDVHFNNSCFHAAKFEEFLEDAKKDNRSLFLGMGDYIETFSDSERLGLQSARLHESSAKTIDDMIRKSVDEFIEKIKFMKGRILGMLEGNHFYMFSSGISSTQYMCERLGCRYLGASALIRISFRYTKGARSTSIDIFAHHGKGASRLVGGSLNSVVQMAECAEADIFCMGHDHRKSVGMGSRLCLTDGKNGISLKEKRLIFIRTGSFLKGYEHGVGNYVSKKLLNPSDLGYVKVQFHPKLKKKDFNSKQKERFFIDSHASI